jgi:preprotein translocase subunit SecG
MSTVETVLLSLLVIDALALTVLVLLQQGKGADVGAAFGSGSSGTMFGGAGGATFLTRATAWLAIGFFIIAFSLAYMAKQRSEAAGSLGIPTVPTQSSSEQLTLPQESVDLPAIEDDVPALEVDDSAGGDIPDL